MRNMLAIALALGLCACVKDAHCPDGYQLDDAYCRPIPAAPDSGAGGDGGARADSGTTPSDAGPLADAAGSDASTGDDGGTSMMCTDAPVGTTCNESPAGSFMSPDCCGGTTLCIPNSATASEVTRHYCTKFCAAQGDCPDGTFCYEVQPGTKLCVLP
jgi:hypothetical protein